MTLEEKQMKADELNKVIESALSMRDSLLDEIKKEKERDLTKYRNDIFAMVYHANALIEKYDLDLPNVTAECLDDGMVALVLWGNGCVNITKHHASADDVKSILIKYIHDALYEELKKSI